MRHSEGGLFFLLQQISPGVVETEFHAKRAGEEASRKLFSAFKVRKPCVSFRDLLSHLTFLFVLHWIFLLCKFQCLKSAEVADAVIYALSAPQHVQVRADIIQFSEYSRCGVVLVHTMVGVLWPDVQLNFAHSQEEGRCFGSSSAHLDKNVK